MFRFTVGGAVLALAVSAPCWNSPASGRQSADEVTVPKELEGNYLALAVAKGGKDAPDDFRREFTLRIAKGDFLFDIKGKKYPAKIAKIDAKAKPAAIDLAPSDGPEKGKTFLGIYSFSSGELTLAFTEKGDRPRDFSGENDATVLRLRKIEKKGKKN